MKSTQDRIYALTHGVQVTVIQVLAAAIILVSDVSLLIVMTLTLFALDFFLALGTILFLGSFGFFFNLFIQKLNHLPPIAMIFGFQVN